MAIKRYPFDLEHHRVAALVNTSIQQVKTCCDVNRMSLVIVSGSQRAATAVSSRDTVVLFTSAESFVRFGSLATLPRRPIIMDSVSTLLNLGLVIPIQFLDASITRSGLCSFIPLTPDTLLESANIKFTYPEGLRVHFSQYSSPRFGNDSELNELLLNFVVTIPQVLIFELYKELAAWLMSSEINAKEDATNNSFLAYIEKERLVTDQNQAEFEALWSMLLRPDIRTMLIQSYDKKNRSRWNTLGKKDPVMKSNVNRLRMLVKYFGQEKAEDSEEEDDSGENS